MSKVRLIDANALGRYLNDCAFAEYAGVGHEREYETMCRVLKCIENTPTVDANHIADAGKKVDAVQVVRCKECRWYYEGCNGMKCANTGEKHNGDWYCADGERL